MRPTSEFSSVQSGPTNSLFASAALPGEWPVVGVTGERSVAMSGFRSGLGAPVSARPGR